jgi:hypothetical protein
VRDVSAGPKGGSESRTFGDQARGVDIVQPSLGDIVHVNELSCRRLRQYESPQPQHEALTVFSDGIQTLAIRRHDGVPRPVFLTDALDFLDEGERAVRLGLVDPDGVGAATRERLGLGLAIERIRDLQIRDVGPAIRVELDAMSAVALQHSRQWRKKDERNTAHQRLVRLVPRFELILWDEQYLLHLFSEAVRRRGVWLRVDFARRSADGVDV